MNRLAGRGFTLVEVLLAVAILAVLTLVAAPSYSSYLERTRVMQATTDIVAIAAQVKAFELDNRDYPDDLLQIGAGKLDPWGRPYVYLAFKKPSDKGHARKDKNLVPINSDFDLYSLGKDGLSAAPLVAKWSQDDVIRANDGGFVGLASDFSP
ncbi:MAG TPA: type II secretion system protein GspG [Burkholderiales bacterium]|jgi:general secretion pathway protein G|nr:type II secretion system protein GspG [Burkholderiales bacterium]